jgi:hypothetical protein
MDRILLMQTEVLTELASAESRTAAVRALRRWRAHRRILRDEISGLEDARSRIATASSVLMAYSSPPTQTIPFSLIGYGLPSTSGIYFGWLSGDLVYVGQTTNLASRCAKGHHVFEEGMRVSWLEFPRHELNFAECFYIGTCRPRLNFGRRAVPAPLLSLQSTPP